MSPIQELVIVSSPRSGTNFFCECLSELDASAAYFEIFNPRGVFGTGDTLTMAAMSRAVGSEITEARDPALISFFAADKLRALQVLRDHAAETGARMLSYKIFPRQASPEEMQALLVRPGVKVAFIVRRRLDVYISYLKARNLDVWKNKSTRDIEITVDVAAFLKWARQTDQWYAANYALVRAHDLPHRIFTYETDINIGKENLVPSLAETLVGMGIDTSYSGGELRQRFRKQDRNIGPFKRIANGEELRAALRERASYNYALSTPLSGDAPA